MLVPNINSKRCHNGRTFGLMFMAWTRLIWVKLGEAIAGRLEHLPAARAAPVAPIAKKYRIVAMVTMRGQGRL